MSNPLYNKFGAGQQVNPASRLGNAMQMIAAFKRVQNDPSQLADILRQNNRINDQQYQELKRCNGNPEQMGRYLLQSGIMNQQQINNLQNLIPVFNGLFNK